MKRFIFLLFLFLCPALSYSAQATLTLVPSAAHNVGTQSFGPANVPTGATEVQFAVDIGTHTDAKVEWRLRIQLSFDNGATWPLAKSWMGCSRMGGAGVDPAGAAAVEGSCTFSLVEPSNPDRRLRGEFEVRGSSVNTIVRARIK